MQVKECLYVSQGRPDFWRSIYCRLQSIRPLVAENLIHPVPLTRKYMGVEYASVRYACNSLCGTTSILVNHLRGKEIELELARLKRSLSECTTFSACSLVGSAMNVENNKRIKYRVILEQRKISSTNLCEPSDQTTGALKVQVQASALTVLGKGHLRIAAPFSHLFSFTKTLHLVVNTSHRLLQAVRIDLEAHIYSSPALLS